MPDQSHLAGLRKKLSRVKPENDLESLADTAADDPDSQSASLENLTSPSHRGGQLEDLRTSGEDTARSGLRKLRNGDFQEINAQEQLQLEAIVERETRPVSFIRENAFDPLPAPWHSYNETGDGTPHDRICKAIPAVGRVEIPPAFADGPATHVGTGFIVGENLLMTNRHVAALFVTGTGVGPVQLAYVPGIERAVDFRSEYQTEEVARMNLGEIVMVHPFWDMALFRVHAPGVPPLKLSVTAPEDLIDRPIAVLGYPAQYKNPNPIEAQLEQKHFQGIYGVKRLAPGEISGRSTVNIQGHDVSAMTHDSSTLPGNSGSAIIDVSNGQVIGLHFAGRSLKANYSVPLFELARDPRVVDLGLNFTGTVPPTRQWESYWQAHGRPGENTVATIPAASITGNSPNSQTWTIPIHVTVSVGQCDPAVDAPTPPVNASCSNDSQPTHTADEPIFTGEEGWFGPSDDTIVARAYNRFSKTALGSASFDWRAAISTAGASHLAYSEADRVRSQATDWELAKPQVIAINGTECFVAQGTNEILIAFRGSAGWGDWLTNFKFFGKTMPYGTVHQGFQIAFAYVKDTLESLIASSGADGKALILTGHSLGGAIATIAAAEWHSQYAIRSVYTFGQPRVGNEDFRDYAIENFASQFYRFVNEDDIVTRVPSGSHHVGKLLHLQSDGSIQEDAMAESTDSVSLNDAEFRLAQANLRAMRAHGIKGTSAAESGLEEGLVSQFTNHSMIKYMQKILSQL